MKITGMGYRRFKTKLTTPVPAVDQLLRIREGIYVEIETESGVTGIGEIAPLPGYSDLSTDRIQVYLGQINSSFPTEFPDDLNVSDLQSVLMDFELPPEVRFGVEQALLDAFSRTKGIPLVRIFDGTPVRRIPVNGFISSRDPAGAASRARRLINQGYSTLKVKVGSGRFPDDLRLLEAIREVAPSVTLRLDANRAWDLEDALRHMTELEQYSIEYIEEPLRNPVPDRLRRLREHSPVPLAVDESVRSVEQVESLLSANAADVYVLKPTLQRGLTVTQAAASLIADAGRKIVLTSTYDTHIATLGIAHLAAALAPGTPHGLSTLSLFEEIPGFNMRDWLRNGFLYLRESPGIGITFTGAVL